MYYRSRGYKDAMSMRRMTRLGIQAPWYISKHKPFTYGSWSKYGQAAKVAGGAVAYQAYRNRNSAPRRRGYQKSSSVANNKKAIKQLKRQTDASTGTMTYRQLNTISLKSVEDLQASASQSMLATSSIETALANLKYYNPAVPGTLTTADASTGTYQRNILVDSATLSMNFQNNYQSNCHLTVYLCKVKDDTDSSPNTAWTNGIADGGNAVSVSSLNQYPSDYNLVKDLYSLKRLKKVVLKPGQSVVCSHTEKDINYDPSTVDSHNLVYQKEYKSFHFLYVIQGGVAHDSSLDEQGYMPSGVDIEVKRQYKVIYNAGTNIDFIHLSTTVDAFTNTPLESHQPIPDNITYSVG